MDHVGYVCDHMTDEQKRHGSSDHWTRMFLVDDLHRLIYCEIPKAGSTAWKTTIAQHSPYWRNGMNVHYLPDLVTMKLRGLGSYSSEEMRAKLVNYTIFMTVRNPIDRLVSAYRDKMLTDLTYEPNIRKSIVKRQRKSPISNEFYKDKPTLIEYLTYLVETYNAQQNDIHWRKMYDLCHPCEVNFTHILKLENMESEQHRILHLLQKGPSKAEVKSLVHENHVDIDSTIDNQLEWCEVPANIRLQIEQLYAIDLQLFNYKTPACARTNA